MILGLVLAACGDESTDQRASPSPTREARTTATATPTATRTPTPTPAAKPSGVAWTHAKVIRRLAGRRLRVAGRRVRIDAQTLTCGGVGRPASRAGGKPAWTRFRCVQPTFPPGRVVGPDAILIVEPTGRRSFEVTSRRLTRY